MKPLQLSLLVVLLSSPVYAQSTLYSNSTSGDVGVGTTSPLVSLDVSQRTDALALPAGSTTNRPSGTNLTNGEIRYNTTTLGIEGYANGSWITLGGTGSGTVNSGTQYQLGYYASTGTAISGTSSITTDASGDLAVSGSVKPSQTGGIIGTTTNNNANTGSVGEYIFANCPSNGIGATSSVTISIASPAVVTWSGGYPMSGAGTWTCPVYFTTTGSLPTGISANTTYWIIPITSTTFKLASSAANALSSTAINTSVSQSGTQTANAGTYNLTSATWQNAVAITLTAGDWDVNGVAAFYQVSGVTTAIGGVINSIGNSQGTLATLPLNGLWDQLQISISGNVTNTVPFSGRLSLGSTTNEYLSEVVNITSGSTQGFGYIGARRAR